MPADESAPQQDERDVLLGAQSNIDFVNSELGTHYKVNTLYGWHHRHGSALPIGKFSNCLIGSRRGWRAYFASLAKLSTAIALCVSYGTNAWWGLG
jgi:hypothetical protein